MNLAGSLISGFTGTSLMTIFSYLVSETKERNFKEPELLAALLKDILPGNKQDFALPAGWLTHYSMGLSWAVLHDYLIKHISIKPNVKNGLVLGCFSGITGIVIWDLVFRNHPDPPRIPYKRFYAHLLLAHLVYSLSVVLTSGDKITHTARTIYEGRGADTQRLASSASSNV